MFDDREVRDITGERDSFVLIARAPRHAEFVEAMFGVLDGAFVITRGERQLRAPERELGELTSRWFIRCQRERVIAQERQPLTMQSPSML